MRERRALAPLGPLSSSLSFPPACLRPPLPLSLPRPAREHERASPLCTALPECSARCFCGRAHDTQHPSAQRLTPRTLTPRPWTPCPWLCRALAAGSAPSATAASFASTSSTVGPPAAGSHHAPPPLHAGPLGPLRPKNGLYDAFRSEEAVATVALVAPRHAWRVSPAAAQQRLLSFIAAAASATAAGGGAGAPPPGAAGGAATGQGEGAGAAARAAAQQAVGSPLLGALFVVAGFSGNLLVYENCT